MRLVEGRLTLTLTYIALGIAAFVPGQRAGIRLLRFDGNRVRSVLRKQGADCLPQRRHIDHVDPGLVVECADVDHAVGGLLPGNVVEKEVRARGVWLARQTKSST